MAKKKRTGRRPVAAEEKRVEQPNKFEMLYNKKKFNVLGKKSKGEQRKLSKSRNDAVEKRKNTLLVEYRQLRKENAFIDRRFGEDDDSLTPEERAIARFQKQRMKELAGGRYALPDEDEGGLGPAEQLTHLGRSLADDEVLADSRRAARLGAGGGDEDDGDAELNKALTRELHFGGGFVPVQRGADGTDEEAPQQRRTKKEVMEEVMAKSKAAKAARSMQREDDLAATEKLDADFAQLLQGGALLGMVRPPKGARGAAEDKAVSQAAGAPDDAQYDRSRRELVFEAKARVGERTRTPEELAELERQRLELLEKQRQKRMAGQEADGDEEADEDDADLPAGGFARRRAKRKRAEREEEAGGRRKAPDASGDALHDDFESGDEEEEGSEQEGSDEEGSEEEPPAGKRKAAGSLQERQQARAAGDHPLQKSLRAASAALLAKHGLAGKKAAAAAAAEDSADEEASDTDDDSAEEEEEQGEDGAADTSGDDEEEEEAGSADEDDGQADLAGSSDEDDSAGPSSDSEAEAQAAARRRAGQASSSGRGEQGHVPRSTKRKKAVQLPGPLDIPYTLPAPDSYAEFAVLVEGRSADDLEMVIQRIRGSNAAALAADNRRKLQVFYGILTQHFALLAGAAPPPLGHLDALTRALLELTPEVPLYAATAARTRLERMQARLGEALAAGTGSAWPQPRALLLLQLWAVLFPASDKRHPVLTPAALLAGGCLAMCPVTQARDIAAGLFLSSLLLYMAGAGQRYAPEPLAFATSLLHAAASPVQDGSSHASLSVFDEPAWLRPHDASAAAAVSSIPPLSLARAFSEPADAEPSTRGYLGSDEFRLSAAVAALGVVRTAAQQYADLPSFPELFAPSLVALEALAPAPWLPQELQAQVQAAAAELRSVGSARVAARRPLVRRTQPRTADVKLFNPRFEDDFAAGKDYDPDRERAVQKRLQRSVVKERRGAMRELRKDGVFLGEARQAEREREAGELRTARRAGFAFLEQQEADFKSGGQKGMWKKKKKK